jgi:TMEM175 potassium channel family protein
LASLGPVAQRGLQLTDTVERERSARSARSAVADMLERRMGRDVERIAFFSDAVFAIAITLLSVRIAVPPDAKDLGRALLDNWPAYLSYALTFYVIGMYWITDHAMFRVLQRYDGLLLRTNLLFLATIAFLPFPTEVIGRYAPQTPAVVLYAGCVVACSLAQTLVWVAADRHGLLHPDLPRSVVRFYRWRGVLRSVPFLVSIPISFIAPLAAMFVWALTFVVSVCESAIRHRSFGDERPSAAALPGHQGSE